MDFSGTTVVRFRTALAGFNKSDVTNYISQTVNDYQETVTKLNKMIEELERENNDLRKNAAEGDYVAELEENLQQLAQLQEENGLLKNRVRQLEYKLEEREEAAAAAPVAPVAPAVPVVFTASDENLQDKELAAYRRAEAMERRVCKRTQLVKNQLDEISGQTSEQFQAAMETVKTILVGIEGYLATLQNTSETLGAAMSEGVERLQTAVDFLPEEENM